MAFCLLLRSYALCKTHIRGDIFLSVRCLITDSTLNSHFVSSSVSGLSRHRAAINPFSCTAETRLWSDIIVSHSVLTVHSTATCYTAVLCTLLGILMLQKEFSNNLSLLVLMTAIALSGNLYSLNYLFFFSAY